MSQGWSALGHHGQLLDSLENLDHESASRMAKGSAAVAELVGTMEVSPWQIVESLETRVMREEGVFHADPTWSLEAHANEVVQNLEGHKTLKKMIVCIAHAYELLRHRPTEPLFCRAFLAQTYKSVVFAANQ